MAKVGKKLPVHGVKGAYVGGDWVDIEDCSKEFNIKDGSGECGNSCAVCPRSRSRKLAVKHDGSYDVVVIGAGCIGSTIARELAKYKLSALLLEASDDVTQGATKGNSGIVHAGYDDKPGSVRAQFCWPGNQMFPQLDKDLHFGYQRSGSLVVARGEQDEQMLEELMERGRKNGIKNLRIVGKEELFKMEPLINEDSTAALYSPDAGTLTPYEFAIALAENAADNGVEVRIRREVSAIEESKDGGLIITAKHWEPEAYVKASREKKTKSIVDPTTVAVTVASAIAAGFGVVQGLVSRKAAPLLAVPALGLMLYKSGLLDSVLEGFGGAKVGKMPYGKEETIGDPIKATTMPIGTVVNPLFNTSGGVGGAVLVEEEKIKCKFVINAAGCASDKIAAMVGDISFKIKPRLGEYLLLHKKEGHKCNHILFPAPDPVLGKGVLVQKTLWGNLILGPTARDTYKPETHTMTKTDIMKYILDRCRLLIPSFNAAETIHTFAGARAKNSTGDWIIKPCPTQPRMIHCAGIDSPGLAASPAIGVYVIGLLKEAGLEMPAKPIGSAPGCFNPKRAALIVPKNGYKNIKLGPPGAVKDPKKNIVCKCEKVTEAEVVDAIRRSLPIDSTQAIRKRVRAGMGHCQGDPANYGCEQRVADIIARECGIPLEAVGRRPWPATTMLPQRWLCAEEKEELKGLKL